MNDLKEYLTQIVTSQNNIQHRTLQDIIRFLSDNRWFGTVPSFSDGTVLISDEHCSLYQEALSEFISTEYTTPKLLEKLKEQYTHTGTMFQKFIDESKIDENISYYVLQFLLKELTKEISFYTDSEILPLVNLAAIDLTKAHGDCLTFFLSWLKKHCKTSYFKDYFMQQRYTMDMHNSAYSMDEYLELCYLLFNEQNIIDNNMYEQAAESKNYTDTWLYLSLHFICSIRYTDLQRIYHPDLPYSPEEVLERIKNGSFTASEAKQVLLSVTTRMCCLPFTPNKTKRHSGISDVKFHVPSSCENHFGMLFALAEAHAQIAGTQEQPLIRKITTYKEINRYMGDEIGDLFLESDFRARSATKSYLQLIYTIGDEVLAQDGDFRLKGSILASLARSHKGNYKEFSSTTYEYLKDARLSGLTPEFIAYELLERGVLSCIASMLLNILTNQQYDTLSERERTSLIQKLNLSPYEIDSVVSLMDQSQRNAQQTIQAVVQSQTDIASVLQRIATGEAFAKQNECLCLMTAIKKVCPYTTRKQCIGCRYEIHTKSTLFQLIDELNRINHLYNTVTNDLEKQKYKKLLMEIIIPNLDEMLFYLKRDYGEEVFHEYEQLIKENIKL
jgi:hypothetical protein